MVIQIFKISTKELYTFNNKEEFYIYVQQITNRFPSHNISIEKLMQYLPVEEYCRGK